MNPAVTLKPEREKSARHHHPWLFSSAIQSMDEGVESGQTVDVFSSRKEFLGQAAWSPKSRIALRFWTWDQSTTVNADFFRQRLRRAFELRENANLQAAGNAWRMVNAESDGIPGLVLDCYSDLVVMQCLTTGAEYWRETIIDLLKSDFSVKKLYERSDVDIRTLEGLEPRKGRVFGEFEEPLEQIQEHEIHYLVDFVNGHKTGFYLDQKENRRRIIPYCEGKEVLNCFSYTGGFSLAAGLGKAKSVLSIDSSGEALELAQMNWALNKMQAEAEWLQGDVFEQLRKFRDQGRSFDLIVLDPPKFAPTAAQVERAARGYKDINLLAMKLLRPGGILVTFSCSGGVSPDLFRKILHGAALDANVEMVILERLSQSADHPVSLSVPESEYLKGCILQLQA